jgi:hypothetical protein
LTALLIAPILNTTAHAETIYITNALITKLSGRVFWERKEFTNGLVFEPGRSHISFSGNFPTIPMDLRNFHNEYNPINNIFFLVIGNYNDSTVYHYDVLREYDILPFAVRSTARVLYVKTKSNDARIKALFIMQYKNGLLHLRFVGRNLQPQAHQTLFGLSAPSVANQWFVTQITAYTYLEYIHPESWTGDYTTVYSTTFAPRSVNGRTHDGKSTIIK